MYEWCGSVAYTKLFAPVRRPSKVIIEAYDENQKKTTIKAEWLLGRVIQHEYDHLDGIVFTDKITDVTKIMSSEEYVKRIVQKKK
jgi:peptide deformylase